MIRTAQHLAAVVPAERALMLITLRYADELRAARGFELPAQSLKSAGVTGKELDLAKRLVDDMAEHWNPDEFKDTYHEDLMRAHPREDQAGSDQGDHPPEPGEAEAPRSAKVIDLADAPEAEPRGGRAAPQCSGLGPHEVRHRETQAAPRRLVARHGARYRQAQAGVIAEAFDATRAATARNAMSGRSAPRRPWTPSPGSS